LRRVWMSLPPASMNPVPAGRHAAGTAGRRPRSP
jgi:hypothetical protein